MDRQTFKKIILGEKGKGGLTYCAFCEYDDITDWCAAFVSFAMISVADIKSFPRTLSCSHMKKVLFSKVNHDYKTAEIGDIILFETLNPEDGPDHVGIVIDNNTDAGILTLIEGNTGSDNCVYSTVNTYNYNYNNSKFDCILDMSDYFHDTKSEDFEEKYYRIRKKLEEILQEV